MADAYTWIIDGTNDGYPYPAGCSALPTKPMEKPYPLMLWRITSGVNEGYPYFLLRPEAAPPPVLPYDQKPYICIYAKDTDKSLFAGNGLAILTPTLCEVTETLNGMKSVQLTHPIDKEGRWELLLLNSILKVDGQLYTIKTVDTEFTGNSGSVTVYAEHIFYQQADGWIYPKCVITGTTGQNALNNIESRVDYEWREGAFWYAFQWSSDIQKSYRHEVDAGCTPIEAILGTYGFIEKLGGELYRDNFYFSINERMEGASDHAFDIRVGKNLSGIVRTVDITSMASYFRGYDAWDGWLAVAWDFEAFFGDLFPHYIVRSENFSQPIGADEENFDYDSYFRGEFTDEVMAFFRRNCCPLISYEITLKDVRRNPDFEIIATETIRVGDKGNLYDERLGGNIEIEITETVYDAIKCEVTSFTVGDRQSFVRTASPNLAVTLSAVKIASEEPVRDASGDICFDSSGEQIFEGRTYT